MQVAKFPIIGLNQDDDDVNLKPGWCREIWNAIPKNGYSKTGIQNLKGTLVRANGSLPAGTNTCIGAFPDKANIRILYFIENSNNDHSVWYFNPADNTHTLVLLTPFLLFDTAFPILSCDFIEDIASWCDDNNEDRSVIVSRAVNGDYTFNTQESFEKQLSLYKTPPSDPPLAVRFNFSGINNISSHSYQFCTQYVYYDDTISLISPLSKIDIAEVYPISTSATTKINVSVTVDADIYGIIKKIYWIYVRNDDGEFNLFKETDLDTEDPLRSNPAHTISFLGTESTETIFTNQVNFIPRKSKNIIIHDQRSVLTLNEFDYEGSDVIVGLATEAIGGISSTQFATKICAPNSSYTVGVLYFDRFGRTPGITATGIIEMPNIKKAIKFTYDDQNTIILSDKLKIRCTPTGTAPLWATKYGVALKQNNTLETAYACLAFPMFYKKNGTAGSSEIEDNGKVFYQTPQNNWTKNIYWKVPLNMPFALDGSFKMRLLNSIGQSREIEDVISIEGDKIITRNFGITNWLSGGSGPALGTLKGMVNVIFEKYKEEPDEVFFEVGAIQSCIGGDPITGSHLLDGDYYYMLSKLVFDRVTSGAVNYGGAFGDVLENATTSGEQIEVPIISQSPTHSNVVLSDVSERTETNKKRKRKRGLFKALSGIGSVVSLLPGVGTAVGAGLGAIGAVGAGSLADKPDTDTTVIETVKRVYTPDYTKIASDSGRAWIDVNNKKVSYEPNTLSISDNYVINSKINGLSDYRNLYQIPISRTPIRKLVSIGASNIMLAIHERTTTSLAFYTGNVLNTTDGSQIIGDGSQIIGYNNELAGGFGTIYPDSVVHYKNRAWWFDPYSGEIVRYNNGLTPIGSIYKMHNFFREKGNQFINPTGRNVIGGFDANLEIVYFTFRSTVPEEEVTVAFIDRQGEERWLCFTDFLPERYAYINERLFGFVNGEMWEFNVNSTYNLFFGSQKTTKVKHLFNPEFSWEKMLLNVHPESNKKWVFDPILTTRHNPVTDEKIEQETSLAKSNFTRRDNGFYADVKRDKNTAIGLLPAGKSALVAGQPMIGKVYEVTLENDDTELVELDFLNYGFIPQAGHNIV